MIGTTWDFCVGYNILVLSHNNSQGAHTPAIALIYVYIKLVSLPVSFANTGKGFAELYAPFA